MKKHLFFAVLSIVLVVFGGGLLFLLMKNLGNYNDVKSKLDDAEARYTSLSGASPYPSPDNIVVIESNLEKVEQFYADLQERLCAGEAPQREIERAQFAGLLETTINDLVLNATNRSVMLPANFSFGFDSYRGQLPEQSQVPRLVRQLEVIRICSRLLFENRISSLNLVQRDVFEEQISSNMMGMHGMMMGGPRQSRSSRSRRTSKAVEGGTGKKAKKSNLSKKKKDFTIEQVTVSFTARDEQIWRVIDAISKNARFTIIKSVAMNNVSRPQEGSGISGPSYSPPGAGMGFGGPAGGGPMGGGPMGGGGGAYGGFGGMMPPGAVGMGRLPAVRRQPSSDDGKIPLRRMPRKERTVAGEDELVQVQLELDVYQFCLDGAPPVKEEAGSS